MSELSKFEKNRKRVANLRKSKMEKNINDAIKYFQLESSTRSLIRQKIVALYKPDKEELMSFFQAKVNELIASEESLRTLIEPIIKEIVKERIYDLAEEYKQKLKEQLILKLESRDWD